MTQIDWFECDNIETESLPADSDLEGGETYLGQQETKVEEAIKHRQRLQPLHQDDLFKLDAFIDDILIKKSHSAVHPDLDLHTHPGALFVNTKIGNTEKKCCTMPQNIVQAHEDCCGAGIFDMMSRKWLGHSVAEVYRCDYHFVDDARYEVDHYNDLGEACRTEVSESECLVYLKYGEVPEAGFWLAGEKYQVSMMKKTGVRAGRYLNGLIANNVSWAFVNRPGRGAYIHFGANDLVYVAFWRGDPDQNGYKCKAYLKDFVEQIAEMVPEDRVNHWRVWAGGQKEAFRSATCAGCKKKSHGFVGPEYEAWELMRVWDDELWTTRLVRWEEVANLVGQPLYCIRCEGKVFHEQKFEVLAFFVGEHKRADGFRWRVKLKSNRDLSEVKHDVDADMTLMWQLYDKGGKMLLRGELESCPDTDLGWPWVWRGRNRRETLSLEATWQDGTETALTWREIKDPYAEPAQHKTDQERLAAEWDALNRLLVAHGLPKPVPPKEDDGRLKRVVPGMVVTFEKTQATAAQGTITERDCHFCGKLLKTRKLGKVVCFTWDDDENVQKWMRWHLEDITSWDDEGFEIACVQCAVRRRYHEKAENGEGAQFNDAPNEQKNDVLSESDDDTAADWDEDPEDLKWEAEEFKRRQKWHETMRAQAAEASLKSEIDVLFTRLVSEWKEEDREGTQPTLADAEKTVMDREKKKQQKARAMEAKAEKDKIAREKYQEALDQWALDGEGPRPNLEEIRQHVVLPVERAAQGLAAPSSSPPRTAWTAVEEEVPAVEEEVSEVEEEVPAAAALRTATKDSFDEGLWNDCL